MTSSIAKVLLRLLPITLMAIGGWLWLELRPVHHAPGVLVMHPPAALPATPMHLPSREGAGEFLLNRIARVHAQGRVLAVHRYRDHAAPLAPVDVVIGWGSMSDSAVLQHLTITQSERRYDIHYSAGQLSSRPPQLPSSKEALEQTVNLHLVPGTPEMMEWISTLKPGLLIDLQGALAEAVNGSTRWAGTLTRSVPTDGPADLADPLADPLTDVRASPSHLKGSCLLFVTAGHAFQGRSQQDLRSRALRDYADQETADLEFWFNALKRRRQDLDRADTVAVREFNREAARYMSIAHPGAGGIAPAALKSPTR